MRINHEDERLVRKVVEITLLDGKKILTDDPATDKARDIQSFINLDGEVECRADIF